MFVSQWHWSSIRFYKLKICCPVCLSDFYIFVMLLHKMNWKLASNIQRETPRTYVWPGQSFSEQCKHKIPNIFLKVLTCFFPMLTFLSLSFKFLSCHIWLNQSHHSILLYKAKHSMTNITRQGIFANVLFLEAGNFKECIGPWISDLFYLTSFPIFFFPMSDVTWLWWQHKFCHVECENLCSSGWRNLWFDNQTNCPHLLTT